MILDDGAGAIELSPTAVEAIHVEVSRVSSPPALMQNSSQNASSDEYEDAEENRVRLAVSHFDSGVVEVRDV